MKNLAGGIAVAALYAFTAWYLDHFYGMQFDGGGKRLAFGVVGWFCLIVALVSTWRLVNRRE